MQFLGSQVPRQKYRNYRTQYHKNYGPFFAKMATIHLWLERNSSGICILCYWICHSLKEPMVATVDSTWSMGTHMSYSRSCGSAYECTIILFPSIFISLRAMHILDLLICTLTSMDHIVGQSMLNYVFRCCIFWFQFIYMHESDWTVYYPEFLASIPRLFECNNTGWTYTYGRIIFHSPC